MQESDNLAGLAAQMLRISKKDLFSGLALVWLLGDELWAGRMFCLIRVFFACQRPWALQYQFNQIVYANNVIFREWLFLLWEARIWIAEVSYTDTVCMFFWPSVKPWTPKLRWTCLVDSTLNVLSHTHRCGELNTSVILLGEATWKLAPGFSWPLSPAPFPFADMNLYPFPAITLSIIVLLGSVSSSESSSLECGLGHPQYIIQGYDFSLNTVVTVFQRL